MTGIAGGLAASIGIAMVITALTLPNRKAKEVIDSSATGVANIIEAALGTR
jgi:hypothetical protein